MPQGRLTPGRPTSGLPGLFTVRQERSRDTRCSLFDLRDPATLPPVGSEWLAAHHRAKLPERRAFCQLLAAFKPSRVLDIGCATGLWLDELDKCLPGNCDFIGLDSDEAALAEARERASAWSRPSSFRHHDLNQPSTDLPKADLTLLANVSPYVDRLDHLLELLARRGGYVAIRQYDGRTLRFGPMAEDDRVVIEASLHDGSDQRGGFSHYDLDRLYEAVGRAPFREQNISFELFSRCAPFPAEVAHYFAGTVWWTQKYLSDEASERLENWWSQRQQDPLLPTYFTEVDLCAVLA